MIGVWVNIRSGAARGTERVRIAMLLHKSVEFDSRVRREASALAAAGHDVTVLELAEVPSEDMMDGFRRVSAMPPAWVRRRLPSAVYRPLMLVYFVRGILRTAPAGRPRTRRGDAAARDRRRPTGRGPSRLRLPRAGGERSLSRADMGVVRDDDRTADRPAVRRGDHGLGRDRGATARALSVAGDADGGSQRLRARGLRRGRTSPPARARSGGADRPSPGRPGPGPRLRRAGRSDRARRRRPARVSRRPGARATARSWRRASASAGGSTRLGAAERPAGRSCWPTRPRPTSA